MKHQFEIISIPSVFESAPEVLDSIAEKVQKGLKVKIGEKFFIVGDLALSEGNQPHKEINSAPRDLDYQVLLTSALVGDCSVKCVC
jgi:plasmid segregation protein ParM